MRYELINVNTKNFEVTGEVYCGNKYLKGTSKNVFDVVDGKDLTNSFCIAVRTKVEEVSYIRFDISNTNSFIEMIGGVDDILSLTDDISFFTKDIDLEYLIDTLKTVYDKINNIIVEDGEDYVIVDYENVNFRKVISDGDNFKKVLITNKLAISYDLVEKGFNIIDYMEYISKDNCDLCVTNKEDIYNFEGLTVCEECCNDINIICSKVGDNDELLSMFYINSL